MPPAISDDEISESRSVSKAVDKATESEPEIDVDEVMDDEDGANNDNQDDEDDEEELDEDEFIVEKILAHMIDEEGLLRFKVKWEGYEKKADQTWEPEDNLKETATEILDKYLVSVGGRENIFEETTKAVKGKKRGRPSTDTPAASTSKRSRNNGTHPADSTPPAAAKEWAPPPGSWEDQIDNLDACQDEVTGDLIVYLSWNSGQKTKHPLETIYKKCPQKMLKYYERHVRIIKQDDNGVEVGLRGE